ncbi:MAG: hypothetical protein HY717_05360 [Planctomycetes bacterium]|nr:hypothetical protein [Planctomycetota bacterium]
MFPSHRFARGAWLSGALAAAAGAFLHAAVADVIYLKNGNQIQGEIQVRGDQTVTVRFPGGTLTIPARDILKIESESRLNYLLSEAEKHINREDYAGAILLFQSALKEGEGCQRARDGLLKAHESLGRQLEEARRLEEARQAYQAVLEIHPRHAAARAALAKIERELEQAAADEKLGAEEIDRGDVLKGFNRLCRLYQQFPERQSRLAPLLGKASLALGHAEFRRGSWRTAETRYLEAIEYQPDLVPQMAAPYAALKIRELEPLIVSSKFLELLKGSEEALEIVPASDILNYFRGLALEGTGRLEDAAAVYRRLSGESDSGKKKSGIDLLRRAAEARILASLEKGTENTDPAKAAASNSAAAAVLPGDFRETASEHFVVYHRNFPLGEEVAAVAEDIYLRLFEELGVKTHWHKPCRIYLYPTQEEFIAATGRHNWTGGSHQILKRLGTLSDHRIDSFQTQPRLTACIIPHEVAHAMLAHRLRYQGEIPLWLNEGYAIHAEPAFVHRHYRSATVQAHKIDKLPRLAEFIRLNDYPGDDEVKLFYAQSYCLAHFLIEEKGMEVFLNFAEELSLDPGSLEGLLKRHYGIETVKALETLWLGELLR